MLYVACLGPRVHCYAWPPFSCTWRMNYIHCLLNDESSKLHTHSSLLGRKQSSAISIGHVVSGTSITKNLNLNWSIALGMPTSSGRNLTWTSAASQSSGWELNCLLPAHATLCFCKMQTIFFTGGGYLAHRFEPCPTYEIFGFQLTSHLDFNFDL